VVGLGRLRLEIPFNIVEELNLGPHAYQAIKNHSRSPTSSLFSL